MYVYLQIQAWQLAPNGIHANARRFEYLPVRPALSIGIFILRHAIIYYNTFAKRKSRKQTQSFREKYNEKYSKKTSKKPIKNKKLVDKKWIVTISIVSFFISLCFSFLGEVIIPNAHIIISLL